MFRRRIVVHLLSALLAFAVAAEAVPRVREPNGAYADRRARLRAQLDGPVILFGFTGREDASPSYIFNQEENFYYLTGHNEPGAAVLIIPEAPNGKAHNGTREVLFLAPRDRGRERWDGPRTGPTDPDVVEKTGFATVLPFGQLRAELESLAKVFPNFYTLLPGTNDAGYPHRQNWSDWLKGVLPQANLRSIAGPTGALRQVKSATELELLQRVVDLSVEAHLEAMRLMRPGIHEYEVAARMEFVHKRGGCEGEAYAPIVGSGFFSTVLHYNDLGRRIEDGDVIVLDVGGQYSGYAADITRTLPANGKFSPRQREIYEIVLGAQNAVLAQLKPGMTFARTAPNSLFRIAYDYINTHGKDRQGQPLGRYFIHGLGHHVGLNVHDAGDPNRPLEPGMVVTIEPGIYIPEENLGVRIEDMVLITETGYELLTHRLPRDPDEIESLMSRLPSQKDLLQELRATAQEVVKLLESGDGTGLFRVLSGDGVEFGLLGHGPRISRAEILNQLREQKGVSCLFFDSECLLLEDKRQRQLAGATERVEPLYSFREQLRRSVRKTLQVYLDGYPESLLGRALVELTREPSSGGQTALELFFEYRGGMWELVGVEY